MKHSYCEGTRWVKDHAIMEEEAAMKTYILEASVEHEEDGRWSAWIEALPGCTTWGYTQEEALETLREAARLYIADMIVVDQQIPEGIAVTKEEGEG